MMALLLAAATIGQVNVGDYFGYGRMIEVQAEPYYEVEDEGWVEPGDSGSYPVYDMGDGGDPGTRAAIFGPGGVVLLKISQPAPGDYVTALNIYPNTQTTGGLVTVSGSIVVTVYDSDANPALKYTLPVFAVFLNPRTSWSWTSGVFRNVPPGCYMTARFTGGGFGSSPSYWNCPGVTDSITIQ